MFVLLINNYKAKLNAIGGRNGLLIFEHKKLLNIVLNFEGSFKAQIIALMLNGLKIS